MNIVRSANEISRSPSGVCLAIGVFDGVHLGHQHVLRQMLSDAREFEALPVAMTFDRHPNSVIAPDRVPPLLQTLSQRLRTIHSVGVETILLLAFDEALSRIPGEQFIRDLHKDLGSIRSICVGSTFTFGHKRSGNVDLLKKLGQQLGFHVHGMAAVSLDGQVVSSTRIRDCIRKGDLDGAGQMLGRTYALGGTVIEGDHLGRKLGFATANLDVSGMILPPNGVYAGHVQLGNGGTFRAVMNIGTRPTLESNSPAPRVEIHLLNFDGNLYGQELEMTIRCRLREEKKFPTLSDLQEQIRKDIATARQLF